MAGNIRNLVLFKLGWVACVLFAAAGEPLLATAAVALVVAAHLASVPVIVKEAVLLVAAAVIGMAWESLLVYAGLVRYPGEAGGAALAPYWIVAMWVLFATTINHGLRWIKRNWMVAAGAGLIGGPLAFVGGAGMGAVEFSNTPLALAAIGAGWALLLPMLALAADTIIDSAWLEPHDGLLTERRVARPAPLSGAEPVPVRVFEKESNRVQ
ncbi:MAG: DUF2878 domain-containing protein [Xanthomonadales bacterium]